MAYETALKELGLSSEQAQVYEQLVRGGAQAARDVAMHVPFSRPLVYKVLDELITLGLAEKQEKTGKITSFLPRHPNTLIELAENQVREAETAREQANVLAQTLASEFNLAVGKPGVRFYEGLEGVRTILEHSLTSKEIIYTYADLEAIDAHIRNINQEYYKKREKLGIKKRGIVPDSEFAKQFLKGYDTSLTETRIIRHNERPPFHVVMQMYDQTTSYITLTDSAIISVLIDDPHITDMHRYLFEVLWQKATDAVEIYGG